MRRWPRSPRWAGGCAQSPDPAAPAWSWRSAAAGLPSGLAGISPCIHSGARHLSSPREPHESARFRHPEARSTRPAGQGDPPRFGRARLRRGERGARRQADRARPRRDRQRGGHRSDVPQIARQHGDREFPDRADGNCVNSAVIVFPGSNCDRDVAVALELVTGRAPAMVWHKDGALPDRTDFIALPGGFSYGDYLRSGAMAARAPIMRAVADAAGRGVPVIGICNGFQVLTEAGLLPGALMRNAGLSFVCREVPLRVENSQSLFTAQYDSGEEISFPVAHHDGNYQADEGTLDRLEGEGRVAFRYLDEVNGSARSIAGILNDSGNVLGLMPHPERVIEAAHGGTDGRRLFEGLLETVAA